MPRLLPIVAAGWGFAIGSALFMAGVPLGLVPALPPAVAGWTFFVGSIFFTTAAALQTVAAARPDGRHVPRRDRPTVDRANVVAALVQLVGTVEFNVTTLFAAVDTLSDDYSAVTVWNPDAIGSLLFLASSAIALTPEVRTRRNRHVEERARQIAAANMIGSILFGLSAVGAWPVVATGQDLFPVLVGAGTFLGGACFLVAAVMMVPTTPAPAPAGGRRRS